MGWPRELVLVRHAESEGNVKTVDERAECGISTVEYALTERGKEQARLTGEYLRKRYEKFDVHYVSYYKRSRETMKIMFPDDKVYEDPRLAESQRGIFNQLTQAQIEQIFPTELARKTREGLYHFRPFGGQNWPDVELRIHSFLGTLHRDCEGKKVVIVVHGHWLILFDRLVQHFSIDEAVQRYKNAVAENASVTIYTGGDRLRRHNEEPIVPWKDKLSANT